MILTKLQRHPAYGAVFLSIIYVVGIVGLNSGIDQLFRTLTPFNLLLTLAVLLYYHEEWNIHFLSFVAFVLFGGWFVEWMGVQTSAVFGSYQYLDTLGWKVARVPVIIGVNWLLLIYSIGSYLDQWKAHLLLKILIGALLMVLVDIFIEPVAIALDFWIWDQGDVPIKNYLGWFIVSLIFFTVFFKLGFKKKNKLGLFVYILQLVFFIIMWLTI